MLSSEPIERAIEHLSAIGDTDVFPKLSELQFFCDKKSEICDVIKKMTAKQYRPVAAVEVLTPKSTFGFRICHQMTATDSLLYTAAILSGAAGIETLREANSGDSAFSYRYDKSGGQRIFEKNRSYQDWLAHLVIFCSNNHRNGTKTPVLQTDISDFYQRIYFHRIENLLNESEYCVNAKTLIKNIIQTTRSKQSFGLPVGSSASRLLAEGILSDTDQMLRTLNVPFSRYVDDYIIIANGQNTPTLSCADSLSI